MESNLTELQLLVIDDEKSITHFLKISLRPHGFKVTECDNAGDGLRLAVESHPHIIVLDLGLPDMDGLDLLKHIREKVNTPVIILTVKEDETYKITGLDNGADDYLVKPFSINELLARLRAVLRRSQQIEEHQTFKQGRLSIDFTRRIVKIDKKRVHLSPIEYDLLKLLIQSSGKVITHSRIYRQIWDRDVNHEGIEHLLRVTISNLRNKIESSHEYPAFILTEPGIGYRFNIEE